MFKCLVYPYYSFMANNYEKIYPATDPIVASRIAERKYCSSPIT